MSVFDLYAAYYDLLYRDKDYAAESDYVAGLLHDVVPNAKSLLELGCGTGGHALEFARRGTHVHGIDLSPRMVELAEARRLGSGVLGERLRFQVADIREFRSDLRFDAVVSLFHVMSYQARNADLQAALTTARQHLRAGGAFVFDCWYGPAVLSDRPRAVTKRVSDARIEVVRQTRPTVHVNENCVDVQFDIDIRARETAEERGVVENHRMRYLFVPEVEHFLAGAGFDLVSAHAWLSRSPLDDQSWYACFVARAR